MTVFIQLTGVGTDSGPFSLFADLNPVPFIVGVSRATMLLGANYTVPDGTATITATSTGPCNDTIVLTIATTTTTTTTTTVAPTTTTTTTTTGIPVYIYYITNGVAEGCTNQVGTTPYYSPQAAPNAVDILYTNSSLITVYSPGVGTIGWSATIGPVTLAAFAGNIDGVGNISTVIGC